MPEVDLSFYTGREQAYVKHCLLEKYLAQWAWKVGSKWDSLVYVDAFSGPWGTKDDQHRDSSFAIAGAKLKQALQGLQDNRGHRLKVRCILIEQNKDEFPKLQEFARTASAPNFEVIALNGDFVSLIGDVKRLVDETSRNPFTFFFLDPKGWKDIPMPELIPLLKSRSCEVLINIMTRDIVRFVDQEDREESYHRLFGRREVLPSIRQHHGSVERTEVAIREYCRSLRDLCGFEYVSEAVILEPDQERIRYFLVFATHYYLGVEVFKDAESKAALIQDSMRERRLVHKMGGDPDAIKLTARPSQKVQELTRTYVAKAKDRAAALLFAQPGEPVLYRSLFCKAMAFPLVTPKVLNEWLCEHLKSVVEIRRAGDNPLKPSRRMLSAGAEDEVILKDPDALRLDLQPKSYESQDEFLL